ncbi:hypothetical protein RRG08_042527 [Elysia crispata]|uniref:Uncharacterized protein n=1 Tax=Elysia crispata TaxID=231223 RepID=A0AAE1CK11_9GAST|nr:hypothetical protein RRG08_042527 [Elysia crispata]
MMITGHHPTSSTQLHVGMMPLRGRRKHRKVTQVFGRKEDTLHVPGTTLNDNVTDQVWRHEAIVALPWPSKATRKSDEGRQ